MLFLEYHHHLLCDCIFVNNSTCVILLNHSCFCKFSGRASVFFQFPSYLLPSNSDWAWKKLSESNVKQNLNHVSNSSWMIERVAAAKSFDGGAIA